MLTVDARNSTAEAVAVGGGRILAVGRSRDIEGLIGPDTAVYRLRGQTVMPGFIEAHNHMSGLGLNLQGVDCKNGVGSIADIVAKIRLAAAAAPPGAWLRAWGYDQSKLAERRHPTRFDLDRAAPDHPVFLERTCGHISAVNSRALEVVGVGDGRDLANPPGGEFGRTADGRLDGVLYETAGRILGEAVAPTYEEVRQALQVTDRRYRELGITSSHDAGSGEGSIRAMAENAASGAAKVRVYFTVPGGPDGQAKSFYGTGLATGFGNERVRVGPFKVFTDGSSSGPTAGTREDYTSQPGNRGILYYSQKELDELIEEAHAHGFQVTAHAVGDRAIEMMLNAIERALAKWPRPDHRHRIEHCAICPPDLIDRIERLGIVPVAQPIFFWEFGDGYLRNYGPDRVRWMFPARSYGRRGIIAAGSSDSPVTRVDPLWGLYEAMTRVTMSGQSAGVEERLGFTEAVRLFTINGAYASFEERTKGSLEPGKLADLIVLDRNLTAAGPEEVRDALVLLTMVGGEVVHERSGFIESHQERQAH